MVKYESQKLAKPLILLSIMLFFIQLIVGAFQALYQVDPHLLSGIINFNVFRALHLNSLLLWILTATFAALIYIVPMLSEREMPKFTKLIPLYMWIVSIGILVTLPLFQSGYNIWAFNQPLLVEGREWVEAGRLWDILLFIGFMIFAFAMLRTLPSRKKWSIPLYAIVLGSIFVMILYIPGNIFFADFTLSEFFRWWTVHYWVENVLEVAYLGAIGILLILMIPSPKIKSIVGKYIFYDVVLAATAGVIGNGHHYFWIGTPTFWILLGGLMGVLEMVPLVLMILDSYKIASSLKVENKPSFYSMTGIATMGFIGPAMFGLVQTWPWTNWWEHGTWVTPSHGHLGMLAFGFGAIALIFYITPDLAGRPLDSTFQKYGKQSFWFLFIGMIIQGLVFAFGGTIEIFNYRILDMDWRPLFAARSDIGSLLALSGTLLFIGFMLYAGSVLRHLYLPKSGKSSTLMTLVASTFCKLSTVFSKGITYSYQSLSFISASIRNMGRSNLLFISNSIGDSVISNGNKKPSFFETLEGIPMLVVLAIIFSMTAITGLWSFSSSMVLAYQDPTLPYILSFSGYAGMGITAVLIALKLIRGVEH